MPSRYEVHIPSDSAGGGPPPADVQDRFAPKYLVGNVLAGDSNVAYNANGFIYIPDPGDGSGIATAFAQAGGLGDVWIRPGVYNLALGAAVLVAPAAITIRGSGSGTTVILGRATGNQTVIELGTSTTLRDLQVLSPAPTAQPAGAGGVVEGGLGSQIINCFVGLTASGTFDRAVTIGINFPAVNGRELVDDCRLLIDSLNAQPTPAASYGVVFGEPGTTFESIATDPEVRNSVIAELTLATGSARTAIQFMNVSGGRVFNVEHIDARTPQPSLQWAWVGAAAAPTTFVRAPKIIEYRLTALDDNSDDQIGIWVVVTGTPNVGAFKDTMIHDCVVDFGGGQGAPISRTAYLLTVDAEDETWLLNTTISNCRAFAFARGFVLDASSNGNGRIYTARITGCIANTPNDEFGDTPYGCYIRGFFDAQNPQSNVRNVGVVNCDFSAAKTPGAGVFIETLGCEDTIVVSNNLTPESGSALVDQGTNTQAGLNIL